MTVCNFYVFFHRFFGEKNLNNNNDKKTNASLMGGLFPRMLNSYNRITCAFYCTFCKILYAF